jgi:hypothetical protein
MENFFKKNFTQLGRDRLPLVCLSVYLSVCLYNSASLIVCPSLHLPACMYVRLFVSLYACLPDCLSVSSSACLFVSLYACQFACLSIC